MSLTRRILSSRNALLLLASVGIAVVAFGLFWPEAAGGGIDGRDVSHERDMAFSLEGRGGLTRGDVLALTGDLALVLRDVPCRLDLDRAGHVFQRRRWRPRRLVGAWVTAETRAEFLKLAPSEVRGLWGIALEVWDESVAAQVARIDP